VEIVTENQGFFDKEEIVVGGHFSLAVITKDREAVGKLLAPYQDNNMGTCPKEYLSFIYAKYEYEKEENTRAYATFEDFVEDYGFVFDMDRGQYGHWVNANAQWDWYSVGGRYTGLIPLKGGGNSSVCRIGEVDIQKRNAFRRNALQYWDYYIAQEGRLSDFDRDQYMKLYGDRENFADKNTYFITDALITPDGIWHQLRAKDSILCKSEFSKAENYRFLFLKTMQETCPDYWITVVDCHI